jgi:hypothetical protein
MVHHANERHMLVVLLKHLCAFLHGVDNRAQSCPRGKVVRRDEVPIAPDHEIMLLPPCHSLYGALP